MRQNSGKRRTRSDGGKICPRSLDCLLQIKANSTSTISRSRHHFGSLYREEDGNVYIKLNLQIRFCK
ncbi:MAG: HpaII family restriction endonuclease [Paludibacteraceae bacterium]|nr:HpaII family restriction endonuclease [Paludibacteraceae bacterium]